MKKAAYLILIFISVLVLLVRFLVNPLTSYLGFGQRAGIKITSIPQAKVFLDDKEAGTTPYQNETLKPKEYLVRLSSPDGLWQGKVSVKGGTLAVVNRELSSQTASSSGEVLTLTSGKGAVVVSNPSQAALQVDGKNYGKTPLSISDLASGEHTFLLSHDNYLKRSIRAFIPANLVLNLVVDLAIAEADLTVVAVNPQVNPNQVVVKDTPTGFLRIREQPSIASAEVGRISPGDKLILLEEVSGWDKVRLPDGRQGYVSSSYVKKQTQ